jgi:uncharacterized protein (DUF433 family)
MQLPEFLTEWPFGEIVLTGHRIGLYHVITRHNEGYSAEMLQEQFPTLPLGLIHQVLQFYTENRAEVDAYVARTRDAIDRLCAATPRAFDWAELRRRMDERRQAGKS